MNKAKKICCDMLVQRGFTMTSDTVDGDMLAIKDEEKIIVFYCFLPKLNINAMKEYMSTSHNLSINHFIIIYKGCITPSAKKVIDTVYNMQIEIFTEDELQFNITKHRLVRPHIKIDKGEDKFWENNISKIPYLLKTDPLTRFYNFQKGDLIKVVRDNGFVSYRVVK